MLGIIDIALVPSGPIFIDLVTIVRDDSTLRQSMGQKINIAEYRKFLPHHLGIVFLAYRDFNLKKGTGVCMDHSELLRNILELTSRVCMGPCICSSHLNVVKS